MIAAHLSPDAGSRRRAVEGFLAASGTRQAIYVCPEASAWRAEDLRDRALVVPFERMDDRDTWLTLNAMVGPETALVMECVSRYPKITSTKFANLQRLSKQVEHRMTADIVPFTLGIEYVYTPYSYLDRSILGFAHWYAFREGNLEQGLDGDAVSSHDPVVIARKLASVTTCDGATLLAARTVLAVEADASEHAGYAAKKAALFEEHSNPTKIVTRLADHAHAFRSRTAAVVAHVRGLPGRTLVLTNLGSYADKLGKALAKSGAAGAVATSFALAVERRDLGGFDNVVYAEAPIVKSYLALDVEAGMRRDATVTLVRGDTRIDSFLHDWWGRETGAIDAVTTTLLEARHGA
ncbi:hypothetical protein AO398_00455 [Methylobacterium sp. GXS13]|uniref:hypothetical protein n=1 Tax=Methylobacterium sp. GXS13 TaxID=1730094 RepID=UPI00071BC5C4|nr:hypothetical protein [Methylobacterium sp. GXS13]KST61196.1 hypothetical protein AO398_00455 [Methylobacterium sp. GXS13]